jgi:hypothetical protein
MLNSTMRFQPQFGEIRLINACVTGSTELFHASAAALFARVPVFVVLDAPWRIPTHMRRTFARSAIVDRAEQNSDTIAVLTYATEGGAT